MSAYKCLNEKCSEFGKVDDYYMHRSDSFRFIDGVLRSINAPCPKCGSIREEINPNKDIPLSEKKIEIAKYASASPEQKRAMLKKRSQDHYKKEIAPYKEHKLSEATKAFKEASKK